jgi:thiamine-monophosphate kinase
MAVNLSDIAAMGGTPRYALSALALPEKFSVEEVDALYDGMKTLAGLHGVELVGGDTSASPDGMVITLTLLGEAARPILRSGAQPGDLLMGTGSLGLSAAGLALLEQSLLGVSSEDEALVLNAHRRPTPRIREGQWLAREGTVHAMIDLSDGLATDLRHIANESKVSAVVRTDRLPIPAAVGRLAALARQDVLTFAVTGGEDFELLIAVAPGSEAELRRRFADETGTAITVIGEVAAGPPTVEFLDGRGQRVELGEGYDHFANRPRRERR